jgi:hypothetical protein
MRFRSIFMDKILSGIGEMDTTGWTTEWVDLEENSDQTAKIIGVDRRYFVVLASNNRFEQSLHILRLEGRSQCRHLIDHAPQGPDI